MSSIQRSTSDRFRAKIIAAKTIEARVLDGIRTKLLTPQAMAESVESLRQANVARRQATLSARTPMEKELASIERQIERAQLMCMEGAMEIEDLKARSLSLRRAAASFRPCWPRSTNPAWSHCIPQPQAPTANSPDACTKP